MQHPLDKLREEALRAQEQSEWFDEWARDNPEAIKSFLDDLRSEPLDAIDMDRITAGLKTYASHGEIAAACRASEYLHVIDYDGGSAVGLLDDPALGMPNPNIPGMRYFVSEHSDRWVEIPPGGSDISYVSVRDKDDIFIVPELTEIEQRTGFDLCFRIMEALGLEVTPYGQD